MTVWIEPGDQYKSCHTEYETCYNLKILFFILVYKHEPDDGCGNIEKPQKVGNDKIFAKRNIMVNSCLDHVKTIIYSAFKELKR